MSRPICNAFILDPAAKTCRVGAYEKEKGFQVEDKGSNTYLDSGKEEGE